MKLSIPVVNGKYRLFNIGKEPNSLPNARYYNNFYSLSEELHQWMIENNIEYKLFFTGFSKDPWWIIEISDLDKAMLYKLTWIGI